MRDVAFSCDDNGVPYLKVAVWSLLAHYAGTEPIRINVFEGFGGHSTASKAALSEIVRRFPLASLRYVDAEVAVRPYADLILNRAQSRWNVFTWTPIFTPQLLSDATGLAIHFDIDMLFNADVSELFELDMGDNLIACCYEYDKYGDNAGKVIWQKGILPSTVERYFNTGVLVFDVAKCREERTWQKLIDWYREHYDIADRIEQDAWNALYHDRVKTLPVRWNFHDRAIKNYAKWNPFERLWLGNPTWECMQAALQPSLLHFWGPKKPWKPSHRPYRKLYHEAMRQVGLKPPREQLLAPFYDLCTSLRLKKIAKNLAVFSPENHDALVRKAWLRRTRLKRIKSALLAPFEWLGIGLGLAILAPLPHRAMLAVCDFASCVMYAFDRTGRRLARHNLALVCGNRPKRVEELILRRAYRNMARTVGHIFWTTFAARRRVAAVGEMDLRSRDFLSANRPAVTVSGHIGCWEILSQLALLQGHSMMSVAKRIGTPAMTRLLMKSRRSCGQEIVPADGAFKPLMAGIRAGKSLGLLVDQSVDPAAGGVWVRFLGRPIPVSAAPAFFAAKASAPIIVAWSRPLRDGRYRCETADVISAAEARNVWGTTQRCAKALERIIRRHPSCWAINYNFFSNVPSAEDLRILATREGEG